MKPIAHLFLMFLGGSLCSSAALLADYRFAGGSTASGDSDINSSATVMSNGNGFAAVYENLNAYGRSSVVAAAVDPNDYFEFTVTPSSGFKLSLTSLTFGTAFYGNQALAGEASYVVRTSLDGFTTNIGGPYTTAYQRTALSSEVPSTPFPLPTFTDQTASLASLNPADNQAVTFRIYIYDTTTSVDRLTAISNVRLNGELLAIPEPSGFTMMALTMVGLFTRRRR